MTTRISLKRLLLTVLLSSAVITIPAVSQAYERGHHSDGYNNHYSRHRYENQSDKHNRSVHRDYGYWQNKHDHGHKYDKHHKHDKRHQNHRYNKYWGHNHYKDHKRSHSQERYYWPFRRDISHHDLTSHNKGLFFFLYD